MPAEKAKDPSLLVTLELLRDLAGTRSFARGEVYFDEGAVRSLRDDGDGVKAVVQGTRRYRVRLEVEDGELDYDCTCPVGMDGEFCKHCVAVGLAWRERGGPAERGGDEAVPPSETDLRDYLAGLDKEELVTLLLDQAEEDERLERRLTLRAAAAAPGGAELSVWKGALDEALQSDGYVHYREAYDYASGIGEVIESLEGMLRAGRAAAVIELAEHGLESLEESLGYVDDSDGWMGGHLRRLQELHLEACLQARPEPAELAERLFEWEMETDYDTFYRAALTYADVLGKTGLAAYRRLAEAEWAKVPALGPGDDDPERYGRRHAITAIMAAIAEAAGDFEALVAVKSRDLSQPYAFLELARLYRDKGEPEAALDWAERGWRAFPGGDKFGRRDERLRDFLAEAYQERGRGEEAVALMWEAFAEHPGLAAYRALEHHAGRAEEWPVRREQALALIRQRIAEKQAKPAEPAEKWGWMRDPLRDHSLLVEVFLHEGDAEGAWREAETGGCSEDLWLALAKRREGDHPAEAAKVYERHVDGLLHNTGNRIYDEAVEFLGQIRALHERRGDEAAFGALVAGIRAEHRRKRNLMKLLDGRGW
jgi:uncharacterized Zn finger protein